jgi:hypothetical protein
MRERKREDTRNKQTSDVKRSLMRASDLIERSKREIQRSRALLDAQRPNPLPGAKEDAQGS